jgi:predicted transcriptional regulator
MPGPKKTKKLPPVGVRLDEDVRTEVEKLAAEERRSLSFVLNEAARFYLEHRGKLKAPKH